MLEHPAASVRELFLVVPLQRDLANRETDFGRQHALGDTLSQFAKLGVVAKLAGGVLLQHVLIQQALDEGLASKPIAGKESMGRIRQKLKERHGI